MAAPARALADPEILPPSPNQHAIIGSATNFWLHSPRSGFDLTHPPIPTSPPITPRLRLSTTTTPITIDPAKTALVIIDMQNFFLSEDIGRAPNGPGHKACDALLTHAIPAARKAGIQIIWLSWGLTDEDVEKMPPATLRAFGFEAVPDSDPDSASKHTTSPATWEPSTNDGEEIPQMHRPRPKTKTGMTENGKDGRIYKGLGAPLGRITLCSTTGETGTTTTTIDAGRLLMRSTWNATLYAPLHHSYLSSLHTSKPDVLLPKNRLSGLSGASTPCTQYLHSRDLRTLLFAGVNTDQCVAASLQDASAKGWDCVLLADGCGSSSPDWAVRGVEWNVERGWGFVSSCLEVGRGVVEMVHGGERENKGQE